MRSLMRRHGLTIVLMAMFAASLAGMLMAGLRSYNQELVGHGQPPIGMWAYAASGEFISALFENWESEFLQMAVYVMLTAVLHQRGSSESKDPDQPEKPIAIKADSPWPVRKGGLWLALYARSLGLALALLFVISFVLHWLGSWRAVNHEARLHGEPLKTAIEILGDSRFWFESLQNWQSEFLATAVLVVLSIVLRQRNSPESKPVEAPHSQTGS